MATSQPKKSTGSVGIRSSRYYRSRSNLHPRSTSNFYGFRVLTVMLSLCWYGMFHTKYCFNNRQICLESFDVDPESFCSIFISCSSFTSTFTWSKFYSIGHFTLYSCCFNLSSTLTSSSSGCIKYRSRPIGRRRARPLLRLDVLASGGLWLICLLLLSGDVELNPGPCSPRYPCGVCGKAVKARDRAVACDGCDIWYHTNCMLMNSHVFNALRDSDISWLCFTCGLPNFSSRLFETSSCSNLSDYNPFEPLNSTGCLDCKSPTNDFTPNNTSTPKGKASKINNQKPRPKVGKLKNDNNTGNLKCLIINFQSFFNKKEELSQIIRDKKADVIIGTETWLTPEINNSELLLENFDVYRRDRPDQRGARSWFVYVSYSIAHQYH